MKTSTSPTRQAPWAVDPAWTSPPPVRALVLSALELAAASLGVSACSLLLRRPAPEGGEDELVLRVASGPTGPLVGRARLPVGRPIAGRVAASGRAVARLGPPRAGGRPRPGYRTGAFILAPVSSEGAVLGVLCLADPLPGRPFGARAVRLARMAADQVGRALGLGELYARLEDLSLTDALTGLYNRRFLDRALPAELSRAQREGRPLGVAMLDLDGFKALNDRYGHAVGDQALRQFARVVGGAVRAQDLAVRYGGDEFVLLLPGCERATCAAVLRRVRTALRRTRLELGGAAIAPVLSVSSGLALFPEQASTPEDLLARADRALYTAKRRRRG